jgi:alkanesulfonate monooxygenase SsuD/methylene tetrahydromethanopterin reductase-like flavin-dependent oxidoreductase (luciferase family)
VRGDFEMSGAPFERRGAVTEEYLQVLARCLSPEPEVSFKGKYVALERGVFFPKPDPRVPLLYAGESEAALRRAARLCDGWVPLGSPGFIAERLPRLHTYLRANGRAEAISDFTVGFLTRVCLGASDAEARGKVAHTIERQLGIEEVQRHPQLADAYIAGSGATVAGRLREYEQAGANLCVMALISPDLDAMLADMASFAREVMPACAA